MNISISRNDKFKHQYRIMRLSLRAVNNKVSNIASSNSSRDRHTDKSSFSYNDTFVKRIENTQSKIYSNSYLAKHLAHTSVWFEIFKYISINEGESP